MEPELEKLRRFCMAVALVLITYVLAGVNIDTSKSVSVLGLPLHISRPELIPIGLIIASVYSTVRFSYFAFLLRRSPANKRRDLKITGVVDPEYYRQFTNDIEKAFPRIGRHRVIASSETISTSQMIRIKGLIVPRPVSMMSWFENIDYAAPLLLNIFAWIITIWSFWHGAKQH